MTSRGLSLLPSGARIAIYGRGGRGRTFLELVREHCPTARVVCFIDSFTADPDQDPPVIRVDEINDGGPDFDTLVVATSFYNDILPLLLAKGWTPKLFFHDNGLTAYPEGAYPNALSYERERLRDAISRFSSAGAEAAAETPCPACAAALSGKERDAA